jgi:DNA-binding NtrC family response regulator
MLGLLWQQILIFCGKSFKFQESIIRYALSQTGGSRIKTAEFLQINRKALYRKMKRLGIN